MLIPLLSLSPVQNLRISAVENRPSNQDIDIILDPKDWEDFNSTPFIFPFQSVEGGLGPLGGLETPGGTTTVPPPMPGAASTAAAAQMRSRSIRLVSRSLLQAQGGAAPAPSPAPAPATAPSGTINPPAPLRSLRSGPRADPAALKRYRSEDMLTITPLPDPSKRQVQSTPTVTEFEALHLLLSQVPDHPTPA